MLHLGWSIFNMGSAPNAWLAETEEQENPSMAANWKRFAKHVKTPSTEKTVISNLVSKQRAPSADTSNCCDGFKLLLSLHCVCAPQRKQLRVWFLTMVGILFSNPVKTSSWYYRESFSYYPIAAIMLNKLTLLEIGYFFLLFRWGNCRVLCFAQNPCWTQVLLPTICAVWGNKLPLCKPQPPHLEYDHSSVYFTTLLSRLIF